MPYHQSYTHIDVDQMNMYLGIDDFDDISEVIEIIELFEAEARDLLDQIQSALKEHDRAQLKFSSHTLHSSSLAMGACQLAKLCHGLEVIQTDQELVASKSLVSQLNAVYQATCGDLARLRVELNT